jgi:hypothetical protein
VRRSKHEAAYEHQRDGVSKATKRRIVNNLPLSENKAALFSNNLPLLFNNLPLLNCHHNVAL